MDEGFKTLICSCNASLFNPSICGKTLDQRLLETFDSKVDPCGENGEYHSFAFDGPIFNHPILFQLGDLVTKTYHHTDGEGNKIESKFDFISLVP